MPMYRKFTITDPDGKIEFEVYPAQDNLVKHVKDEIDLTLATEGQLQNMIQTVSKFMDGNTISKLEVEEIT